jgi:hypothetical protein
MFTKGYTMDFNEYINAPVAPKELTKKELRIEWREALGWDAFTVVIALKDIEERLLEHTRIRVYKFKGKLEVEESEKEILYVFKLKF